VRVRLLCQDLTTAPHSAGVLVLDDTGDRKDGPATAHVARQYLGSVGKIDSGIVAVASLWADARCSWPVHAVPYTPALRLPSSERDPGFRTKPPLAVELIALRWDAPRFDPPLDDGAVREPGRLRIARAISDPRRTGRGVEKGPKTEAGKRVIQRCSVCRSTSVRVNGALGRPRSAMPEAYDDYSSNYQLRTLEPRRHPQLFYIS